MLYLCYCHAGLQYRITVNTKQADTPKLQQITPTSNQLAAGTSIGGDQ